jgi:phage terminase small subunit
VPRTKPRKPTELLKLAGTYRKDRHGNRADIQIPTLPQDTPLPPPPAGLHPKAEAGWFPWLKELAKLKVLANVDFPNLEIGFRHLSQAFYYSDLIEREGMPVFLDDEALERRKILDRLFQEATKTYLKILYEYGNTPSARAALQVPKEEVKNVSPLEVVLEDRR